MLEVLDPQFRNRLGTAAAAEVDASYSWSRTLEPDEGAVPIRGGRTPGRALVSQPRESQAQAIKGQSPRHIDPWDSEPRCTPAAPLSEATPDEQRIVVD